MYVLSSLLYVSQSSFHVPTQLSTNASLMETQFNFHNYHKEKEKLLRAIPLLLFSRGRANIWELWLKILCVLKAWQFAIATNFRKGRKREKKRQWFFYYHYLRATNWNSWCDIDRAFEIWTDMKNYQKKLLTIVVLTEKVTNRLSCSLIKRIQ